MIRLNLGCGLLPLIGYVNIDYRPYEGVDKVMDLNNSWDIPDNSVEEIRATHVIEHLDSADHFMREAHRVLKSGGTMLLQMPYGNSTSAMCDLTHKRPYYPETFGNFDIKDKGNTLDRTRCLQYLDELPRFEIVETTGELHPNLRKLPKFIRDFIFKFRNVMFNVCVEFTIKFKRP